MSVGQIVERHRLVVCVGSGGVGKTTLAAALALGAARSGRRAMVLTIDPARALGRALGLRALGPGGQRIEGLALDGTLDAAMLDQKRSWDAFIQRYAPSDAVCRAILDNPFYRELSTRFSGAIEYVAIEELCRLHESGRYDTIVLDTPPSAHALDFVRAPTRIDRFLDPELSRWLTEPGARAMGLAGHTTGRAVRFIIRQLERATGKKTFHDLSTFFEAFGSLIGDIQQRARTARALLHAPETAFVLVTGPAQRTLEQTDTLRLALDELSVPLRAVIQNRTHPLPGSIDVGGAEERAARLLGQLGDGDAAEWLRRAHREALTIARDERAHWREFSRSLPEGIELATVPELDRDLCSQSDLLAVAARLWS